jgi:Protein of unknown function (DUF2934)
MPKKSTKSDRRPAKAARSAAAKPAAGRQRSKSKRSPSTEEIAVRAYLIYEAEGGGDDVEHWLRAERELTGA